MLYIRTYSGLLSWPLLGITRVLRTHRLTTKCSSAFFMTSHWHPGYYTGCQFKRIADRIQDFVGKDSKCGI